MRLRPYIDFKDFNQIKKWIDDERIHAWWCANLIKFPIEKENFHAIMREATERFNDSPFVATTDEGELVGFFCYSINIDTNEGMFKFIMTNPEYRGKGYGKEMLKLAAKYAFDITKVDSVQLNVFPQNIRAKKCYDAVGFVERRTDKETFKYKNELWDRCNMVLKNK